MSIQALREKRATRITALNALTDKKDWNSAVDQPIYDAGLVEIGDLNRQITLHNEMNERTGDLLFTPSVAQGADNEYWATASGRVPVMRKDTDFKSLYRADSRGEQPITMSDFLRGIAGQQVTDRVRNALSEGTNTSGGYAVPTELFPNILQAMVPASSLLQAGAGIVDVTQTPAKQYNTAAISTIPTASWRSEAGTVTESAPAFRNVPAVPQSLSFLIKFSRELM